MSKPTETTTAEVGDVVEPEQVLFPEVFGCCMRDTCDTWTVIYDSKAKRDKEMAVELLLHNYVRPFRIPAEDEPDPRDEALRACVAAIEELQLDGGSPRAANVTGNDAIAQAEAVLKESKPSLKGESNVDRLRAGAGRQV